MRIIYTVNQDGRIKTPCPNGKKPLVFTKNGFESRIKVNCSVCRLCKYFEGQIDGERAITCSYPDSVTVARVYYTTEFDVPQGIETRKLLRKDSLQNLKKKPRYAYIEIDGKRIYLGK